MKATLTNGILIEGTPSEIAEYIRITDKPPLTPRYSAIPMPDWWIKHTFSNNYAEAAIKGK